MTKELLSRLGLALGLVIGLVIGGGGAQSVSAAGLTYASEHWPPYVVADANKPMRGIDLDVVRELARRLGVNLKTRTCAWSNCIKNIKLGRTDLIGTFSKRPEREAFVIYLEPSYVSRSPNVFYSKKGTGIEIRQYEDIHRLRIGVVKGSAYFHRFESDPKVRKVPAQREELLMGMLDAGRFDAFIGFERVSDYMIRRGGFEDMFEKSKFRNEDGSRFHLALSKKSAHAEDAGRISHVLNTMIADGFVGSVLKKWR